MNNYPFKGAEIVWECTLEDITIINFWIKHVFINTLKYFGQSDLPNELIGVECWRYDVDFILLTGLGQVCSVFDV